MYAFQMPSRLSRSGQETYLSLRVLQYKKRALSLLVRARRVLRLRLASNSLKVQVFVIARKCDGGEDASMSNDGLFLALQMRVNRGMNACMVQGARGIVTNSLAKKL